MTWEVLPEGKAEAAQEQEPKVLGFDSFDGKLGLDWKILNPDPSHYSLSKNPGMLTIITQEGGFARSSANYKNLFLVDCPTGASTADAVPWQSVFREQPPAFSLT